MKESKYINDLCESLIWLNSQKTESDKKILKPETYIEKIKKMRGIISPNFLGEYNL
jgi:hypothetical protein